ncbi:MAG: bifunctional (p)ppGpp synthetase/guanosine-3',5'-bis(diphosphate) 3'-pyrophosphohydrolase [Bacteroidales bacterium]|nr:bifunctional (p)ppGpp synthetase/guanosine-3',5'-bis(diphosphate) 3'-pyrophosphohydrolase [Bacteroidales bacterium]
MYEIDEIREAKEIEEKYRQLIALSNDVHKLSSEEEDTIFRAFSIARKAHSNVRRKSGEPYIFHPLEVATIAVKDIGIGPVGVVCALLHDVVEDTEITLDELRSVFGDRVAKIIDGLTKISVFDMQIQSIQAENFKKILLAMCDDVYVIFLKLCDRLHNMRTLDSMESTKQLAISSETQFLYIPLAHRLGLYSIKSELEDLCMKYTNPKEYYRIKGLIEDSDVDRDRYIDEVSRPLRDVLDARGFKYTMSGRVKSIFSIWNKMVRKGVPFSEVYDVFAIRIILDVPTAIEKEECWRVYSIITSMFRQNPERTRDWITTPKANGYESLHTTVMGHGGKWLEIQIRSKRMDEVAERGVAAHFLYKENHPEEKLHNDIVENWLHQIRENLDNPDQNALDFVEDFKQSLYTKEIYLFTPKGMMITLPAGSTVLDFAFAVHTELGLSSMGAKVNSKVVPNNYVLRSGAQIQILSSKKVQPTEEWLSFVKTTHAKIQIKKYLREQKKLYRDEGERKLHAILSSMMKNSKAGNIDRIKKYCNIDDDLDLYYKVAKGEITKEDVERSFQDSKSPWLMLLSPFKSIFGGNDKAPSTAEISANESLKEQYQYDFGNILLDAKYGNVKPEPALCCNPVPGDDVIGFVEDDRIVVHRTNCRAAIEEMATHKNRIVKAKWRKGEAVSFLAAIEITAMDRRGLLQDLTRVISEEMDLNIRGITIEGSEGVGRGLIMVYVSNLDDLNSLMQKLQAVDGIENVKRV